MSMYEQHIAETRETLRKAFSSRGEVAFYIYSDEDEGFVTITLTLEEPVWEYGSSHSHEEGWSCSWERYELDPVDGSVLRTTGSSGRDCDGRTSRDREDSCLLDELATQVPYDWREDPGAAPFFLPNWQKEGERQRDFRAEAAGY